ncbi:hypothetical protein QQY66_04345 [Streptomyces sp. DG2A-72]|uniref:WYL domain-containing protein n=1 Tax=Streptomyces sp. DG2A-72 TaxID=3051386 RepID=UPI00265C781A|nr:WYL domain-containing protein [Streptomyces sp. DG2A-72]MDO0930942.1 hypothetical protein [Streptomyces sp. DG2A-72]
MGPEPVLAVDPSDDLDWAARWLAYLNLDLDVLEPAELTDRLRTLGRRLTDRY